MKAQGASDSLARTVAVNGITIGQVFYLLYSRYLLDSSLSLKALMGNKRLLFRIVARCCPGRNGQEHRADPRRRGHDTLGQK